VITWTAPGVRAARVAGASPTYTVQVSTDGGTTWQTMAFALREPRAVLDRQALEGNQEVLVRITSTDGFRSVTTERRFRVADL
jgi:hypothetical protein